MCVCVCACVHTMHTYHHLTHVAMKSIENWSRNEEWVV